MKKNIKFLQLNNHAHEKAQSSSSWSIFADGLIFIKLFFGTLFSLQKRQLRQRYASWGVIMLLGALLSGTAVYLTLFAPSATADYELPPRDPLTHGVTTSSAIGDANGVRIFLNGAFAQDWPWDQMHWQENLWHVIEWQDDKGVWNRADGWQGRFDLIYQGETQMIGQKEFWADNSHLGTGPFRWVVYETGNGRLMATSSTFHLPAESNQAVFVGLELNAK